MKAKILVLLLLVYCSISCDFSVPFVIDREKEYILRGKCGTIKISGSSFSSSVIIGLRFNGNYQVNTDLLKIETFSDKDTITDISFRLNNDDFKRKKMEREKGENLSIYFSLKSTIPYRNPDGTILILPSDFIQCEGKPIITDTIRIQLVK